MKHIVTITSLLLVLAFVCLPTNAQSLEGETRRYAKDGATGTVVVQVTIDETGKVVKARAVSGERLLHEASVDAARRAKFSPTLLCGEAVKVTGIITYNFVSQ